MVNVQVYENGKLKEILVDVQCYNQAIFKMFAKELHEAAVQVDELGEYPDYRGSTEDVLDWFDEIIEDLERKVAAFRDITNIPAEPKSTLKLLSDTLFDLWKQTEDLIDREWSFADVVVTHEKTVAWFQNVIISQLNYALAMVQNGEVHANA
ncbi:hypothetical protein [Alicyclobacillus dauci]|uniref:Uncharacterized protein n=1 Tax=Alicyclobacillus dauci TaxID=1475485 RepID=A0ABY6ZBN9_9BACL|nr:hypothetical protein [Alicyclobacillus dauci]WAH39515.1 hypothetical protein NZD86_24420 [Alicyclobacillus dauci]WAH39575.1 hypothetical protein NZD86_24120 [Alicyclobacillus dauci]